MMMTHDILDCGHSPSPHESFTTGYGQDEHGKTFCYACCADRDRQRMIEHGKATMYLVHGTATYATGERGTIYLDRGAFKITNWPGSLEFPSTYARYSKHGGGFGSQRTDAWFVGPDGKQWHAVCRGDMDLAYCHRLKRQS